MLVAPFLVQFKTYGQECYFENIDNSTVKDHKLPQSSSRCNDECLDVCDLPSNYLIPVAFHVINAGSEIEGDNIWPDESLVQFVMEEANGLTGDHFNLVRADTYYPCVNFYNNPNEEFSTIIANPGSENNEQEIYATSRYNPEKILNIYFVRYINSNDSGIKGFSRSPLNASYTIENDGIVLSKKEFGGGETLAHELGHYLGLLHIWGSSEFSDSNCHEDISNCTSGDLIPDTSPCRGPWPWSAGENNCEVAPELWDNIFNGAANNPFCGPDMTHDCSNVMAYGAGRDEITDGQFNRMIFIKNEFRQDLDPLMLSPTVSNISSYQFMLDWNTSVNSEGYEIKYREVGNEDFTTIIIDNESATSWIIDNLSSQTEYEIKIKPLCASQFQTLYVTTLCDATIFCDPCNEKTDIHLYTQQDLQVSQISGNLVINSGATISVNTRIEFRENSKLIVKPGAKLIIEGNGLLTKCPDAEYWQGIIIEGLNNYILGTGTGGEVEIRNGGTVEYAKIGVNKVNQINSQSGNYQSVTSANVGNLIISSSGTIQNCEIGVRLNSVGALYGFGPGVESSTIEDAFFRNNKTGIQLNHNHGLSLNRNTFEYNDYGIEATNSSADVYDNNFADYDVSIMINALYPSLSGFNIERNAFTNGFAVYTETLNNAEYLFINQNVSISAPIFTHGLTDYQVTSNDVIDCFRGMEFSATGSDNANLVYSNSFSNNGTGVNVDGNNNMEYRFNCFENTANADIGLGYGTSIREVQGQQVEEAANCFDNGARIQTVDDDPELTFRYWKYPQPVGNPNWDCKEPRQAGAGQNFNLVDAVEEINEACGSGVNIYGSYPNFLIQFRDCQDFINRNYNDVEALEELISSLEEEIDRLGQEVASGQLNYWIARTLIAKYKECIDRAKKNIVTTILQEPNGDPRDRAITYLSNDDDFTFNIMAYSLMMSANEYARALAYLQTLNPSSEDEYDFIEVQSIYHQYLADPIGFSLSSTDRNTIYNAGNKRLELAGFVRKVYHQLTGERILLDVPMYDDPRGDIREAKEAETKVNIYPNPSIQNADLTIEVDGDFLTDINPVIKVYNAQGQLLISNALRNKRQTMVMPDQSGLLFITIDRDGEVIHSQKLIRL